MKCHLISFHTPAFIYLYFNVENVCVLFLIFIFIALFILVKKKKENQQDDIVFVNVA